MGNANSQRHDVKALNTDIAHHRKSTKQKQLTHGSFSYYQTCLNIGLWEGDMLHPSGLESLSLPWSFTQQFALLSYSSNRSSRLEVESCWLFGGLLLLKIMANNSTNGSVGLL